MPLPSTKEVTDSLATSFVQASAPYAFGALLLSFALSALRELLEPLEQAVRRASPPPSSCSSQNSPQRTGTRFMCCTSTSHRCDLGHKCWLRRERIHRSTNIIEAPAVRMTECCVTKRQVFQNEIALFKNSEVSRLALSLSAATGWASPSPSHALRSRRASRPPTQGHRQPCQMPSTWPHPRRARRASQHPF